LRTRSGSTDEARDLVSRAAPPTRLGSIVDVASELLDGVDLLLDDRPAPVDGLCSLPVVPEARR